LCCKPLNLTEPQFPTRRRKKKNVAGYLQICFHYATPLRSRQINTGQNITHVGCSECVSECVNGFVQRIIVKNP